MPSRRGWRASLWSYFSNFRFRHPETGSRTRRDQFRERAYGCDAQVVRFTFEDNDRAQTERETRGLAKVVARRNGRVLGASILGPGSKGAETGS